MAARPRGRRAIRTKGLTLSADGPSTLVGQSARDEAMSTSRRSPSSPSHDAPDRRPPIPTLVISAGPRPCFHPAVAALLRCSSLAAVLVAFGALLGVAVEAGAQTTPGWQPRNLAVEATAAGNVLTWQAPVGPAYVSDYRILRHRPELGEAKPLVYVDWTYTPDTTYTDTDVELGVLYVYRVKAVVSFLGDLSEASEAVEIRVPELTAEAQGSVSEPDRVDLSTAPTPPANLEADADFSGEVKLTWDHAAGDTPTLTEVQYRKKKDGNPVWDAWEDLDADAESHRAYGLDNGVPYHFQVRAVNSDGNGSNSNSAIATPTAQPFMADANFQLHPDQSNPFGLWSDETTLYVSDWKEDDERIFAYRVSDGRRLRDKEIDLTSLNDAGALWSDGTLIWTITAGSTGQATAYNLSDGWVNPSRSFNLASGHDKPEGAWSDGTTLWISDLDDRNVYAYDLSAGTLSSDEDISTVYSFGQVLGLWSDGTTMWVGQELGEDGSSVANDARAYRLSAGTRRSALDLDMPPVRLSDGSLAGSASLWSDGTTMWSVYWETNELRAFELPIEPPTTPGATDYFIALGVRLTQINLVWTTPSGEPTGYEVQWSADGTGNWQAVEPAHSGTSTQYSHTGLTATTTYFYRVRGVNAAGPGAWSAIILATTTQQWTEDLTAGRHPQNLTAEATDAGIVLSWDAPQDAADEVTGYQIVRRRPGKGERTLMVYVEDTGSAATTYTDAGVTEGVKHTYRVRAIRERELSRVSNYKAAVAAPRTDQTPAPNNSATGAPTIGGTPQVGGTLTADTSAISDADGLGNAVFAYQWTRTDGTNTHADISGATGATYTLVADDAGMIVGVRVSFTDDAGNAESLTSAAMAAVVAEGTDLPHDLAAVASDGAIVLTWQAPVGPAHVSDYRILRHRPELGEAKPLVYVDWTYTPDTTYTDTDVELGVLYVYRVKAVVSFLGDLSEASEAVEIRVPELTAEAQGSVSEPDGGDLSADTLTVGRAAVGATATGDIGRAGDRDWFAVELEAGQTYVIEVEGEDSGGGTLSDPELLGLHDADGTRIAGTQASDGGKGNSARLTFTATESGVHYVAAGGGGESTGTYTVWVTGSAVLEQFGPLAVLRSEGEDDYAQDATTTGTVAVDDSASGEIESAQDQDWYAVALVAGKRYRIDLEGSETGQGTLDDPYLRGVYTSEGTLVADSDDDDGGEGSNSRLEFVVTASGTYYVAAGAYLSNIGTYRLSVADISDDYPATTDTTGVVTVGGSATGVIEVKDDRDWFAVELVGGKAYRIDLEGSETGRGTLDDPYLRGVYTSEGTLVADSDDDDGGEGSNSQVTFVASATGTYYIAAGADGTAAGSYTVSVADIDDYAADATTTGTAPLGGTVAGEVETEGDRDWFAVELEAGRPYRIDLEGSETGRGTLSDTYLYGVYTSEDTLLADSDDDDGGEGSNSRLELVATASGTYYIAAGAYGPHTGTYQLSVTGLTDDYPADTDTPGTVAIDGSVAGRIETKADQDWFAVELVAGRPYRIDLEGAATGGGTLRDPYLRGVYAADGTLVADTGRRRWGRGRQQPRAAGGVRVGHLLHGGRRRRHGDRHLPVVGDRDQRRRPHGRHKHHRRRNPPQEPDIRSLDHRGRQHRQH